MTYQRFRMDFARCLFLVLAITGAAHAQRSKPQGRLYRNDVMKNRSEGDTAAPRSSPRTSSGSSEYGGDDFVRDIFKGIDDGLKGAADQPRPRNQRNPRNDDDYDDDEDYEYERAPRYRQPRSPQPQYYTNPQPVPVARPVPVPVNPKPNTKPPEVVSEPKDNSTPQFWASPMSRAERSLATAVVEEKAEEAIDEIEKDLGDAAKDPEVSKLLEEARQKIADGEPLEDDWSTRLSDALRDSTIPPPPGHDEIAFGRKIEDAIGITDASAILKGADEAGDAADDAFPSGDTDIVTMPYWPDDEMGILPGGCVMVGTGGAGSIGVVTADAAEILDMPLAIGEPQAEATADVTKRPKSGVLLMNPEVNGAAINYVVANTNYEMQPGHNQPLPAGTTWEIRFDRGQGHGEARYGLTDGTYVFGSSEKGWELYKQGFAVTIDNGHNENVFYYVIDNTQQEVAAGAKKSHTSLYPILVRFDRGDGGDESQKKIVEKDQQLVLAINPHDGKWDLYPPASAPQIAEDDRRDSEKSSRGKTAGKGAGSKQAKGRTARLLALMQASKKK